MSKEDMTLPGILWILDDEHNLVPVDSVNEWSEKMSEGNFSVAIATVGPFFVSTVFLGIDTSSLWDPALFQTIVFSTDEKDNEILREERQYKTWAEAVAGHAEIVKKLKEEIYDEQ